MDVSKVVGSFDYDPCECILSGAVKGVQDVYIVQDFYTSGAEPPPAEILCESCGKDHEAAEEEDDEFFAEMGQRQDAEDEEWGDNL
jgi:hypothetical protein